jgi:hypothetical protein
MLKTTSTENTTKRVSKSQINRANQRSIDSFNKSISQDTSDHTIQEVLKGESTVNEALDLVNDLRKSDPFPNRTLANLKKCLTYGEKCDLTEMGRAVQRCKGAILTVQSSEKLNKCEQQVLISGLTGVGTTNAMRESCKI